MTTTICITTDGDFGVPLNESTVKFGTHGYLLATDSCHLDLLGSILAYSNSDQLYTLIEAYLSEPADYFEYGNWSIIINKLPQPPSKVLSAASVISPIIKD